MPCNCCEMENNLTPIVTIDRRVRLPLSQGRGTESAFVPG